MKLSHLLLLAMLVVTVSTCSDDEPSAPAARVPAGDEYKEPPDLMTFPFYESKWLTIKEGETVRIETPEESWSLRFFDHGGPDCVPVACNLPETIDAAIEVSFGPYHSYGRVPVARSIEEGTHVVDFSAITVTTPTYTGRFRLRSLHPIAEARAGEGYRLAITSPVSFPDEQLLVRLRGVDLESFCPCKSTCAVPTAFTPVLDLDYQHRRYRWTPADGAPPVPFNIKLADLKIDACNVESLGFDSQFTVTVTKR